MMDLLLKGVRWDHRRGDIRIANAIIQETGEDLAPKKGEAVLEFENHFIYPGLINSHDHLEMNLYPKLGTPPYANYMDWAKDIYRPEASPIREIQKVDIVDRLMWGGLKNLVSAATSVIHHNPWHSLLGRSEFPVNVLKKYSWAHSLAFEKDIRKKYRTDVPFIIHAGEGVDEAVQTEISSLTDLKVVGQKSVLVHAIAVDEKGIRSIAENKPSIVWCPTSNNFMFGTMAPISELKRITRVALGTDSTLTGPPTLLEEMRTAAATRLVSDSEIFNMVTELPAAIFGFNKPTLNPGSSGTLWISAANDPDYIANIFRCSPEDVAAVVVNGRVRLADRHLSRKFGLVHSFVVNGKTKYTDIAVGKLKTRIRKKVDEDILTKNPLWRLIAA